MIQYILEVIIWTFFLYVIFNFFRIKIGKKFKNIYYDMMDTQIDFVGKKWYNKKGVNEIINKQRRRGFFKQWKKEKKRHQM